MLLACEASVLKHHDTCATVLNIRWALAASGRAMTLDLGALSSSLQTYVGDRLDVDFPYGSVCSRLDLKLPFATRWSVDIDINQDF